MQSSTLAALYVRLSSEDLNRELSKFKLELIRNFVSKEIVSNEKVLKLNIIYKFDIRA